MVEPLLNSIEEVDKEKTAKLVELARTFIDTKKAIEESEKKPKELKAKDKMNVLRALFSGKIDNITLGFFNLLEENKRIAMLLPIAKQYSIIYDFLKNMQVAKVTTAVAITKDIEDKVLAKIVELTGDKANIENEVNPAIIGGFILRVGDVKYAASISNYLNTMKKKFDNSPYIPKISIVISCWQ